MSLGPASLARCPRSRSDSPSDSEMDGHMAAAAAPSCAPGQRVAPGHWRHLDESGHSGEPAGAREVGPARHASLGADPAVPSSVGAPGPSVPSEDAGGGSGGPPHLWFRRRGLWAREALGQSGLQLRPPARTLLPWFGGDPRRNRSLRHSRGAETSPRQGGARAVGRHCGGRGIDGWLLEGGTCVPGHCTLQRAEGGS